MKKIIPLLLILVGSALLITSIVFWINTKSTTEQTSFVQSLLDGLTLIMGLGASIKGWMRPVYERETHVTNY